MREAVIAAGEPDWVRVAARCGAPCDGADVFYQKHMTHHLLPDMSRDWLSTSVSNNSGLCFSMWPIVLGRLRWWSTPMSFSPPPRHTCA